MSMAVSVNRSTARYPGNRRVVIGVVVSLALHALCVLAYRDTPFRTMALAPAAIEVTIAPPPPAPPAPPEPPPPAPPVARATPAAPSAPAAPRSARTARQAPPQAVIAVPDESAAEPAPFVVQQEADSAPPPRFDMDAARAVARANAHLRDPAKEGTALAQFPEPPLQTESKLARGIAAAKRPNCKDGLPGGLLAPIYLLMEKKDSGCKW